MQYLIDLYMMRGIWRAYAGHRWHVWKLRWTWQSLFSLG